MLRDSARWFRVATTKGTCCPVSSNELGQVSCRGFRSPSPHAGAWAAGSAAPGKLHGAPRAKRGLGFCTQPSWPGASLQLTFQPQSLCTDIRSKSSSARALGRDADLWANFGAVARSVATTAASGDGAGPSPPTAVSVHPLACPFLHGDHGCWLRLHPALAAAAMQGRPGPHYSERSPRTRELHTEDLVNRHWEE